MRGGEGCGVMVERWSGFVTFFFLDTRVLVLMLLLVFGGVGQMVVRRAEI